MILHKLIQLKLGVIVHVSV